MTTAIYRISHRRAKGSYIGQAIDHQERWDRHKRDLAKECHANYKLQETADRHGVESLKFEIVERCDRAELDERELFWIAKEGTWNLFPNQAQAKAAIDKGTKPGKAKRHRTSFPGWVRWGAAIGAGLLGLVGGGFWWGVAGVGLVLLVEVTSHG